jgi:hypothetical protein
LNNAPSQNWQDTNKALALQHTTTAATVYDPLIPQLKDLPPGTVVRQAILNKFKGLTNDPGYAAAMAAIDRAKQDDPSIDPSKMDGPAMAARAQADHDFHIGQAKYYATNSGPNPQNSSVGGIPSSGTLGQPGMGVQPPAAPAPTPNKNVPTPAPTPEVQPPQTGPGKATQQPASAPAAAAKSSAKVPTAAEIQDYASRTGKTVEQVKQMLRAKGIQVQ